MNRDSVAVFFLGLQPVPNTCRALRMIKLMRALDRFWAACS
jgi:hypothetical protein